MPQAVARRPPIVVVTFDPRPVHMTLVVDEVALGQGVSPKTSVSPCQYHPPHLITRCVRKVKIHHVYAYRDFFTIIMATLPSTLILYLSAVLV